MDLVANMTAACPSALSSTSGEMFAGAIAAVVAAFCGITTEHSWPPDKSHEIFGKAAEGVSYDFIVVGAGTAGSLVASGLSSHSWSVLLVEAGGDPGLDSEIPAFLYNNLNTDFDWKYKTFPDGNSCLGQRDHSCSWSQGKGLGGSGSINAMLYIKGHHKDYDYWKKQGNIGWGNVELSEYFNRIENKLQLDNYKFHANPLYSLLEIAYDEIGVPPSDDDNVAVIGSKVTKILTNNGKRLNTAKIFLDESKHLHIMKNTIVHKVIIDPETKITAGVEVRLADGAVMQIRASKEVILSAGSIGTPQILMLSGIGSKTHLEELNIKPLLDLPAGKNLQDHLFIPLFLKTKNKATISPEIFSLFVMQYLTTRTGPLSTIGVTDFMAFINTDNRNDPDIQFHHTYFPRNDRVMLSKYLYNTGYKAEVIQAVTELNKEDDLIGIYPTLLRPKSRGEVLLTDNKPTSKPIIKAHYFQKQEDIKQLIQGIKFVAKLQTTRSFESLDAKLVQIKLPFCSEFPFNTDDYWECYIRYMATTVYHPVGTAKMGPKEDTSSVVNHQLLVHGVKKLRVVDASIMPVIVGANTMATTLGIAEKAVDMIRKKFNLKDEL